MSAEHPGIAFERAVAAVQSQFDPAATVTHNETIVDRLGHARQFDVVVRGSFAGQKLIGVIECKVLGRKVGTPEIDAFITKSQDINANFKIVMSRRGFTRLALEKCAHYGIHALSLLGDNSQNLKLILGTRWEADVARWGRISVTLRFVEEPSEPALFNAEQLTIGGKRVLDWFTNYLCKNEAEIEGFGWVAGIGIEFSKPQSVELEPGISHLCRAIEFMAERVCDKFERIVSVSGTGFYDWNSKQATFPPGATIETEPVPMNFSQWETRTDLMVAPPGFMNMRLVARTVQFEHIADAIDLEAL